MVNDPFSKNARFQLYISKCLLLNGSYTQSTVLLKLQQNM